MEQALLPRSNIPQHPLIVGAWITDYDDYNNVRSTDESQYMWHHHIEKSNADNVIVYNYSMQPFHELCDPWLFRLKLYSSISIKQKQIHFCLRMSTKNIFEVL